MSFVPVRERFASHWSRTPGSTALPVTASRRVVIGIIAGYAGLGALYGGYNLLSDASGLGAKQAWLQGTPFPDYTIPGLYLLIVIGGGMLLTAAASMLRPAWAAPLALAMGVILIAWGIVETSVIGYRGLPQLVLLALFVVAPGVPLIAIGWHGRRSANDRSGHGAAR